MITESCKKESSQNDTKIAPVLTDSAFGMVTGRYDVYPRGNWEDSKCKILAYFHNDAVPTQTYCSVGKLRLNEMELIPKDLPNYRIEYSAGTSNPSPSFNSLWGGEQEFEIEGNLDFGFRHSKIKFVTPKILKVFSPEPVDSQFFYLFPSTKDYPITWNTDSNSKNVTITIDYFGPMEDGSYPQSSNESFTYSQPDNGYYLLTSDFLKKFPYGSLFVISVSRNQNMVVRQNFNRIKFDWTSKSILFFVTNP
jgi:hypothetical protein